MSAAVTSYEPTQARLQDRELLARDVLEALSATVYLTDAAGRLTFYNRAAAVLWGRCPKPGGAQWCGSWRLYWPDGTPLPHDQCPMAVAVKQNRQVRGAEALAERPDGARVPFAPHPTPLRDPDGELTGAVNLLVDTTEHRSGEAARRGRRYARLWRKEAEHHANNLLMAILPIAARIGEEAVQPRRQPQGRARALALRIMDENGLGSEPTGSRYSGRGSRPRASRADCGLWGP